MNNNKKNAPQKTFLSYHEALQECPFDPTLDNDMASMIFEKTKNFTRLFIKKPFLSFDKVNSNGLLLLGLTLSNGKNVLDFGGACGIHYFIFKSTLGKTYNINWNVIETTTMCSAAGSLANEELHFYSDLQTAASQMQSIDLLFSSGTIQCLENPKKTLKEIAAVGANYILLNRFGLTKGDKDTISTKEVMLSSIGNGELLTEFVDKKIKFPVTYISENDFNNIFRNDYIVKFIHEETPFSINGEPMLTYGILLEKRLKN